MITLFKLGGGGQEHPHLQLYDLLFSEIVFHLKDQHYYFVQCMRVRFYSTRSTLEGMCTRTCLCVHVHLQRCRHAGSLGLAWTGVGWPGWRGLAWSSLGWAGPA